MADPSSGGPARSRPSGSDARYADRYFGSAVRGGPDPESTDAVAREVPAPVPDETGTDPRALAAPPWHSHAAARAALVGALFVGAFGGAYGWDRWHDRELELAARAAVDITSDVTVFGTGPDGRSTTLSIRVHNEGTYPVTLTGLRPADPRLAPARAGFDPVAIEPGSSDVVLARYDYACDRPVEEGGDRGDVVAQLRAADGTEHDRGLRVTGLGPDFATYVTEQCIFFRSEQPTFEQTFRDIIDAGPLGEDAVTANLLVNTFADDPGAVPNIVDLQSRGGAFLASWDPASLVANPETGGAEITVTWTVGDCAAALVADENAMMIRLTGQMPSEDRTTTIGIAPSTGLIVQLVRLAERVCH